jgi:GT2 family glycosyltransferase
MRPDPRTLAIILNWNGADHTLTCLEHLAAQTTKAFEVLVIDNGSTDDSVVRLTSFTGMPCEITALPRNVGFAAGMNVGIQVAMERGREFVWLVNSDAFAEPDCLEQLVTFMDAHPPVVIATPMLLNADGSEQIVGGVIDWSTGFGGFREIRGFLQPAVWGTWIAATAPVFRLSGLQQTGVFDPRFFAYWEDIDLSVRVFRAGGDLRGVPGARVLHMSSASSGGVKSPLYQFLMVRNRWLFLRKNAERRTWPRVFLHVLSESLTLAGILNLQGHPLAATAILQALRAAAAGRFGDPPAVRQPGSFTRLLIAHPWRVASLLNRLAGWCPR